MTDCMIFQKCIFSKIYFKKWALYVLVDQALRGRVMRSTEFKSSFLWNMNKLGGGLVLCGVCVVLCGVFCVAFVFWCVPKLET